jgi:nicotinamidase-related amidase
MQSTALLIIDIQNDYFPGGPMVLDKSEQAGEAASRLLAYFRGRGLPVVFMQHISTRPDAIFFVPNTPGVEINNCVQPMPDDKIIQKNYPNSFRETELLSHLQSLNIKRLVICGMMTHMCVDATTRAATDLGFTCWVAQDACATRQLLFDNQVALAHEVQIAFLAALQGNYGKVMPVKNIIWELQQE